MPVYQEIPDGMIAEDAPVTSRLVHRNARNQAARNWQALTANGLTGTQASLTISDTVWDTLATLRLYIPDAFIGEDGTRLVMQIECTGFNNPVLQEYRIAAGASGSNVQTNVGPDPTVNLFEFTLDWTPSAGIAEIEFQAHAIFPSAQDATMTWSDTATNRGHGYVRSLDSQPTSVTRDASTSGAGAASTSFVLSRLRFDRFPTASFPTAVSRPQEIVVEDRSAAGKGDRILISVKNSSGTYKWVTLGQLQ